MPITTVESENRINIFSSKTFLNSILNGPPIFLQGTFVDKSLFEMDLICDLNDEVSFIKAERTNHRSLSMVPGADPAGKTGGHVPPHFSQSALIKRGHYLGLVKLKVAKIFLRFWRSYNS